MKFLHFLCFILLSQVFFGQTSNWKYFDGIKVQNSSGILANSWSGSFNNAQMNSIDLNFDGLEDLWIFDRVAQRSITFRQENKQWIYDYSLEKQLPIIADWLLIEDYDGDGRKDVFTSTSAGIKVFRNSSQNSKLSFELVANPLKEEGFSGEINLYVASTDIPVIKDLDGDGDLDILAFESAGHIIELHQNFAMDRKKIKGLDFQKKSGCWGNLVYQDCSTIYLNQGCEIPGLQNVRKISSANQILHSGNSIALFPRNGSYDIWMGHVGCESIASVKNEGLGLNPYFSSIEYQFPRNNPVKVSFPSAFIADVDFDGKLDAIISPNASDNLNYQTNFKESAIQMTESNGILERKQNDFLQNTSIEVGENASPLFFDVDQDGDLDLLIGNALGQLYLFERSGQQLNFKSNDFGALKSLNPGYELRILFADWNHDGEKELCAVSQSLFGPGVYWYDFNAKQWQKLTQGDLLPNDQFLSMDVDLDGRLDNLILHRSGQVDLVNVHKVGGTLQIQKIKEDWGGLLSKGLLFQSFVVFDELGTGQLTLLGINKEGFLKKALLENGEWKEVTVDLALQNRFGKNVQMSVSDFSNDGKIDLILGTSGGGLMLFENLNQSSVFQSQDKPFLIWPNPIENDFFVRSSVKGILKVIDIHGKILFEKADFPKNESIKVEWNNQFKGMYFVQLVTENGKVSSEKIIIH